MSKKLKNKKVLITAGPTREHLDPIRFMTNSSSGEMGLVLAHVLQQQGARVTVVLGPTSVKIPPQIKIIPVKSAMQMSKAVKKYLPSQDAFIATAAVSDYRFEKIYSQKMKKEKSERMMVSLVKNPDILLEAGEWKRRQKVSTPILVGYALETQKLRANALKKLEEKNCDLMIGNSPQSLSSHFIQGLWLEKSKQSVSFSKMTKKKLSQKIAQWLNQTFNS